MDSRPALAATLLALILWASPATADSDGTGCAGFLNGTDVGPFDSNDRDDALTVSADGVITYRIETDESMRAWTIRIEYGPAAIVVGEDEDRNAASPGLGTSAETEIDASDLTWMGRGIYRVVAESQTQDGTHCSTAVLMDIEGRATDALAGWMAILVLAICAVALVAGTVQNAAPHHAKRGRR